MSECSKFSFVQGYFPAKITAEPDWSVAHGLNWPYTRNTGKVYSIEPHEKYSLGESQDVFVFIQEFVVSVGPGHITRMNPKVTNRFD